MVSNEDLVKLCKVALHKAHEVLLSLGKEGTVEVHNGHIVDITTKGDKAVSDALINLFKEEKVPAVLYSEESGRIELATNPKYTISFDDLDGTNNYHRGQKILPYCTLISIFDSSTPKFKDAIVAGVIEHHSGTVWHAVRGSGTYRNDKPVHTSEKKEANRKTLVVMDHYATAEEVNRFHEIHENTWVKDFGSSALHLAGVSDGTFDAFVTSANKAHELGAGYLLVKEAGGSFMDLQGKEFDDLSYDFDETYPVIAAATKELGNTLLSLQKATPS